MLTQQNLDRYLEEYIAVAGIAVAGISTSTTASFSLCCPPVPRC